MSVINKMLQDLDRRQGVSDPDAALVQQVRSVPPPRKDREWFWRIVAVLMIGALGWVAWVAWQLQLREPVATVQALKAAQNTPRNPPPTPAPAAPKPAAQEPADLKPVAEAKPAVEKPAPQVAETMKLAPGIETPIREQPRKPAIKAPAPGAGLAKGPQWEEPVEIAILVHAGEETTLSSQMAGKIQRIHAGLGEAVKAGARLIEFDCSEQVAQQQAAGAEYRGARETHFSRLRLQALGAAGELDVTLAAAAAEKARSQVALRESQTAYCAVAAPFSGKVARMRVKVAESVPAGHALLDLVNPASLRGQLFVPAGWVTWLRPNAAFEVKFKETGRTYRARVAKLNARVEGVSQQLEVEARFEGVGAGLLPGMVGAAVFPNRPAQ